MGHLLNAPKKVQVTAQDRAILDLKVQRDKLQIYQKKISAVIGRETQIAREHLKNKDQKRALLALKKKKYQETLMEKTDNQLMNLEQMVHSIEFALVEKQVLAGLKNGTEILQQLNNEMKIEDVDKLMDDTAEAIAYQKEVEELLYGKISEEDEASVLEELEQLEKSEASKIAAQLPNVPTSDLPTKIETEDEEKPQKSKIKKEAIPA